MKNHSFVAEILFFSLIFSGFVLPPIFNASIQLNTEAFSSWTFPYLQLLYAIVALLIYLFFYDKNYKRPLLIGLPVLMTVCQLMTVAFLIKFISTLPPFIQKSEFTITKPDNSLSWIFCILNFLFAAFYEEIIYRFYLSDAFIKLINRKWMNKFWTITGELFAAVCFALAHIYLGIFSVINALFAHIILRHCYKKTGLIWYGVCAHFVYNVISLILL